jgi:hypothetical protein
MNSMHGRPPIQDANNLGHGHGAHAINGLGRLGTQMRREYDVRGPQKRALGTLVRGEHVNGNGRKGAVAKSSRSGFVIDEISPRSVDKHRSMPHLGKQRCIHERHAATGGV